MKNSLIALPLTLIAVLVVCLIPGQTIRYIYEPEKIKAIITAYSSTEDQTDSTPNLTAYGTKVRKGIVANNCLPRGTQVKIGASSYVVEDKKNPRYGCEWFDIWFESRELALEWGIKEVEIVIHK